MNPAPISNRSLLLLIGGAVLALVVFCRVMDVLQVWERNGYRPVRSASSSVYQAPVAAGGAATDASVAPSVSPSAGEDGSSGASSTSYSMVHDQDMANFYNSVARDTQLRMSEDAVLKASREANRSW